MQPLRLNLHSFRRGLLSLPRRRSLVRSDGFEPAAGRFGAAELVLARSLCRHGRFDLNKLPVGKRLAALRLQLTGWSPFAEPDYAVAWADGVASVWCWDAARLRASLQAQGRRRESFQTCVPETLLVPPVGNGLRLLRCIEGYEAQSWRDGALQASRWWPLQPGADEWLSFMRGVGVEPGEQQALPAAQGFDLLARPWAQLQSVGDAAGSVGGWEPVAYAALALALGVPCGVMAVREWQIHQESTRMAEQLGALKQSVSPLLTARETAFGLLARLRALDGLQRYPDMLALMAAVADALPADGIVVREWEVNDGTLKLQIASSAGPIIGTDHIAALERTALFDGIKMVTQADPKLMGFSMRLRERRQAVETPARP